MANEEQSGTGTPVFKSSAHLSPCLLLFSFLPESMNSQLLPELEQRGDDSPRRGLL